MGGCSTKPEPKPTTNSLIQSIRWALDNNALDTIPNYMHLLRLHTKTEDSILDFPVFEHKNMKVSILGYTLCNNQLTQFKFLYESMNGDPLNMENIFAEYGKNGIEIICEYEYIEFMDYYLPIFEELEVKTKTFGRGLTTLQKLAERGELEMIKRLFFYFEGKAFVPDCLDFGRVNRSNGENVALCACRSRNFSLIRFLHERCGVDFCVENSNGENALTIFVRSEMTGKMSLSCFLYIRDTIQVPMQEILTDEERGFIEKMMAVRLP